jgi:hypothetical protein
VQYATGVFVDLNSVESDNYTNTLAANYLIDPIRMFIQRVLINGKLDTLQGWGKPTSITMNNLNFDDDDDDDFSLWDESEAVTGYDAQGLLRCGVCGAKMKLTKKDIKRGLTPETKLQKHMQMLHDREQRKRITRMKTSKKKKPLSDKEMERFLKYEAATVGVYGNHRKKKQSRKPVSAKDTPYFQALREKGMKCRVATNVDEALTTSAQLFLQNTTTATDSSENHPRGVVIVVSRDSSLAPLLAEARHKGFVTVTVSPPTADNPPTKKALINQSDIILEAHKEQGMYTKDSSIEQMYRIMVTSEKGKSAVQSEYVPKVEHISVVEDDDSEDEDDEWDSDDYGSDYDEDDQDWQSEYDLYGNEEAWRSRYDLWGDEEGYWRATP